MSKQPDIKRPKGILKKASKYSASTSPAVSSSDRTRQVAIHHAGIAHEKKDAELRVLAAIEELVEFPSAATKDPLYPAPSDAHLLKTLLRDFQKSDYDDLIEERNIDGKCGYALCPRPNRSENSKAKYRIVTGSGSFKVVDRKALERWCSDVCAEHALYIQLQLEETPAQERSGGQQDIVLRGERAEPVTLSEIEELGEHLDKLAMERGEDSITSFRRDLVMDDLRERNTANGKTEPPEPSQAHDVVDGYTPGASRLTQPSLVELLERAGLGDDLDDDSDGDIMEI